MFCFTLGIIWTSMQNLQATASAADPSRSWRLHEWAWGQRGHVFADVHFVQSSLIRGYLLKSAPPLFICFCRVFEGGNYGHFFCCLLLCCMSGTGSDSAKIGTEAKRGHGPCMKTVRLFTENSEISTLCILHLSLELDSFGQIWTLDQYNLRQKCT